MRIGFPGMLLLVGLFGLGGGAAFAAGQASIRLPTPAAAAGAPAVSAGQGGLTQGRTAQGGAVAGGTSGQGQAEGQGARGAGTTGTVTAVGEGTLVLRTSQGDATVHVTAETAVRRLVEASLQEVKAGDRVTVLGEPGEGGAITARSIQVLAAEEAGAAAPGGGQRRPGRP